jgi:hypothetical protein
MKWTWDEAKEQERSYFGREPWKKYNKRLGIGNVTEALSSGLAELIDSRFMLSSISLIAIDFRV